MPRNRSLRVDVEQGQLRAELCEVKADCRAETLGRAGDDEMTIVDLQVSVSEIELRTILIRRLAGHKLLYNRAVIVLLVSELECRC